MGAGWPQPGLVPVSLGVGLTQPGPVLFTLGIGLAQPGLVPLTLGIGLVRPSFALTLNTLRADLSRPGLAFITLGIGLVRPSFTLTRLVGFARWLLSILVRLPRIPLTNFWQDLNGFSVIGLTCLSGVFVSRVTFPLGLSVTV